MMKQHVFAGVLMASFAVAGSVQTAEAAKPYASASGVVSIVNDAEVSIDDAFYPEGVEFDTGGGALLALGLDSGTIRFEGEVGYRVNGIGSVDEAIITEALPGEAPVNSAVTLETLTFMGNAYIDFGLPSAPVTPYIMGGIGLASVNFDHDDWSEDDSVFAWQAGAGVGITILPNLMLDLGYRYVAMGDPEVTVDGYKVKYELDSHTAVAGLRVGMF
ncbi:MAG TPA: porin family protein [Prosthecochloris aestuarii]|uniref:Porin family protein n=1 Tax=Prosthecochloris aestuarii TaxID=1102 RepID=A0A831WP29_PROAE|nr:porin family protein [Prosthecochloris aestuarii]